MAHHNDRETSAVADKVGPFSAIFMLGGFIAAIWVAVKHPRVALMCVIAGLLFAHICPSPTQHPLLGLAAIVVGFYLAPTHTTKKGK
jgi:hypothetical protein